mmetsp:Transcript_11892/g.12782  ORF Transcript_11892/g.12782 Transcript_11892/m.12782 type:complete len:84 (-) Transcript_11892:964-1215(-)
MDSPSVSSSSGMMGSRSSPLPQQQQQQKSMQYAVCSRNSQAEHPFVVDLSYGLVSCIFFRRNNGQYISLSPQQQQQQQQKTRS